MKSRTSFFNATVLRKDITRFAPAWGLYAIGLLLFLLIPNLDWSASKAADSLGRAMTSLVYLQGAYGGICALLVFGDLFNVRLCYATHALPLRREGWFLTHYTAGLLFSFVPNLLITLCFLSMLQGFWYMAPLWLLVSTLQFLFFFGLGAFSAVCAGSRLGACAVYLILNFFLLLVEWYVQDFYEPLLYGVEIDLDKLYYLMPLSKLQTLEPIKYTTLPFQVLKVSAADWVYLGVVGAVGLVFALLGVLVYRKRDLETAGDFLSLQASKPVFLLIYTLAVGYLISILIAKPLLGLAIGLLVGFFTGKMLLERTVRVFRGWSFLQLGVLLTALAVTIGLTALDAGHVSRRVPDTDQIASMHFYAGTERHRYMEEDFEGWSITDPEQIEQFRQFHEDVSDGRYKNGDGASVGTYVHYELKNGRTLLRYYEIPADSEHGEFTRQQLSRCEAVFHTNDWQAYTESIQQLMLELEVDGEFVQITLEEPEQLRLLLDAIKADCDAGNMVQHWSFHDTDKSSVWLYVYDQSFYDYTHASYETYRVYTLNLNIYDSCANTLSVIEALT